MATKLRITFTGMCLFSEDGDDVLVELTDARIPQTYGGHPLDIHIPCVIGAGEHLKAPRSGYDALPISGANWLFEGAPVDGGLGKPKDVAEVADFDPNAVPDPARRAKHDRIVGSIRLRGGEFTDAPRRKPQGGTGRSGPWHAPRSGSGTKDYYWQVTWVGEIAQDGVTLDLGHRTVTLQPNSAGEIDFVVANLPPDEVRAWKTGDPLREALPARGQSAHHFRWFFWMLDLPPSPDQEVPETANKGVLGLAYTCLIGGD